MMTEESTVMKYPFYETNTHLRLPEEEERKQSMTSEDQQEFNFEQPIGSPKSTRQSEIIQSSDSALDEIDPIV